MWNNRRDMEKMGTVGTNTPIIGNTFGVMIAVGKTTKRTQLSKWSNKIAATCCNPNMKSINAPDYQLVCEVCDKEFAGTGEIITLPYNARRAQIG